MLRFPQSIVFAIIAFNFTIFAVLLQLDLLFFHALWEKLIVWTATVGAWAITYQKRHKYFTVF